jgi:hypothetical protein
MESTVTSGRDPDDDDSSPALTFGIFHPLLREFRMQCETADECEEWCKCLSLQDAKVKLDDFELLTVIGQVGEEGHCMMSCVGGGGVGSIGGEGWGVLHDVACHAPPGLFRQSRPSAQKGNAGPVTATRPPPTHFTPRQPTLFSAML